MSYGMMQELFMEIGYLVQRRPDLFLTQTLILLAGITLTHHQILTFTVFSLK